jgi:hypothetical protein
LIRSYGKDTKLVALPEPLVERLQEAANRKGLSITDFTARNLEQVLRAEESGTPIQETIETHRLLEVQLASGAVLIPRRKLNALVRDLFQDDKEATLSEWRGAGRWYGEYMRTLFGENALAILEDALKISWNLDEVSVKQDGLRVSVRLTSFVLSKEATELLVSYITGVFKALGYEKKKEDSLRGLATMAFERVYHTYNGK